MNPQVTAYPHLCHPPVSLLLHTPCLQSASLGGPWFSSSAIGTRAAWSGFLWLQPCSWLEQKSRASRTDQLEILGYVPSSYPWHCHVGCVGKAPSPCALGLVSCHWTTCFWLFQWPCEVENDTWGISPGLWQSWYQSHSTGSSSAFVSTRDSSLGSSAVVCLTQGFQLCWELTLYMQIPFMPGSLHGLWHSCWSQRYCCRKFIAPLTVSGVSHWISWLYSLSLLIFSCKKKVSQTGRHVVMTPLGCGHTGNLWHSL